MILELTTNGWEPNTENEGMCWVPARIVNPEQGIVDVDAHVVLPVGGADLPVAAVSTTQMISREDIDDIIDALDYAATERHEEASLDMDEERAAMLDDAQKWSLLHDRLVKATSAVDRGESIVPVGPSAAAGPVEVVTLRHPDCSNVTTVFGADAFIVDIDLGAWDLSDAGEWSEWVEARHGDWADVRSEGARALIVEHVTNAAGEFGHDVPLWALPEVEQPHGFTYDVYSDEAAREFFSLMERGGVGEARIAAMKAARAEFLNGGE